MLSAFTARPIVELKQRDKSKIESIISHSDQLLVGLNTGSLRIYRVNDEPSTDLLREYEKFSKYKIEQLAVFKEANILISLSNAICSIHELGNYELQEQLGRTKGATLFAVTSNIVNDDKVPTLVSRLAVAVKRRLLLWSWHDGEISDEPLEIALPSSIKCLCWASGTSIVAGLSSNYVLINVETKEVKTILGPGSIGEESRLGQGTMSYIGMGGMVPIPLATGLGENEMLLARDINTHFIDRDGEPVGRRQIPWAKAPEAIGYSYPYLLALHENKLEIRNPQSLNVLQSIELPGANKLQVPNPNISLAHQGKGFLVASDRTIWRMTGLNYDEQIDTLLESQNYDEALSLLEMIEETLIRDKPGRLRQIKMMKAQKLFDEKKFRDALDLFAEVSAPPERVIKLYPSVITGDESKMDWSDKELKPAVRELQGFLADIRRRLQRFFDADQTVKNLSDQDWAMLSDLEVTSVDQLLETARLVDTTLFRAHMYATPSLAGSLFRISNFCDPDVVMEKLEETGRDNDLIEFLYGKKLHRQALEKLQKLGQSEDDASRIISYLQNLPPDSIDLIFEFSGWPMEKNPSLAMEIFTADTENAEMLPRTKVLTFLESVDKNLAIQYLEHIVNELNDLTPALHQKLLLLYVERLKTQIDDMEKFLNLLRTSNQYSPGSILEVVPPDTRFSEVRAILFGKMGKHKQALEIYVFQIHDLVKAEEYCNQVHLEESKKAEVSGPIDDKPSIYQILLDLYLKADKPMVTPAMEIMARHGARLPASSTLAMIPEELLIKELEFYFRGRIRNANTIMKDSNVIAGLRKVDTLRIESSLLNDGRGRKVIIDEDRMCGVCHRRLGGSVISVFPE